MTSPPPALDPSSFDLSFPEPAIPLLQGAGKPCSWRDCMRETAAQTIYYLKHFGHLPPSPPPTEPFSLDPAPPGAKPSPLSSPLVRSLHDRLSRLLALLPPGTALSSSVLMRHLGLKHRANFRARYLHPALHAGLIERTHPLTLPSPHQRYRRSSSSLQPPASSLRSEA